MSAWSPDGHFGSSDGCDADATVAADQRGEATDRRRGAGAGSVGRGGGAQARRERQPAVRLAPAGAPRAVPLRRAAGVRTRHRGARARAAVFDQHRHRIFRLVLRRIADKQRMIAIFPRQVFLSDNTALAFFHGNPPHLGGAGFAAHFLPFKIKTRTESGAAGAVDNRAHAFLHPVDMIFVQTHVSDLLYWDSEPAKLYGVRGIPANFLIDKDGVIVAKNLRGKELDDILGELLK